MQLADLWPRYSSKPLPPVPVAGGLIAVAHRHVRCIARVLVSQMTPPVHDGIDTGSVIAPIDILVAHGRLATPAFYYYRLRYGRHEAPTISYRQSSRADTPTITRYACAGGYENAALMPSVTHLHIVQPLGLQLTDADRPGAGQLIELDGWTVDFRGPGNVQVGGGAADFAVAACPFFLPSAFL